MGIKNKKLLPGYKYNESGKHNELSVTVRLE